MKKILIVDDAAFMRCSIKMMLERHGFEIIGEASDGVDAISKYHELKPDIVSMDITMPKLGGIEAVRAIMKLDPQANIVMISAMGYEGLVRDAIMAGAKNFLVKPFTEEQVVKLFTNI